MSSNQPAGRRGFTLIELLVVIAIIAILASILFPVFARARESARQTACRSNEKQILSALQMYTNDYDEVFPMVYAGDPTPTIYYTWPTALAPYIKNNQLWKCNSDGKLTDTLDPNNPADTEVTYGYNYRFLGPPAPAQPAAMASINKPSDTVAITDRQFYGTDPATTTTPINLSGPWYNHNEFTNVGFVDGHVKSMKQGVLERTVASEDGQALTGLDVFEFWNLY